MKKLFLVFALILFTATVFAQEYGVSYTVAAPTSKVTFYLAKNNTLKVTSTHNEYSILKDIPAGTLVSTAIADLTWLYPVGSATSANSTITTLTSTTANITTANIATTLTLPGTTTVTKTTGNANSATFSGSIVADSVTAPLVAATSTLILPGTTTATKTTGNANSVTLSGSLVVGGNDTLTTTHVATTTATVGTTLTLPGATTITKTSGNGNSVTTSGSLVVGGNDTLTTTHVAATTVTVSGLLTASVLPTFTIAAGQLTPTIIGDTIGVAVAGLTTNSIALVSYAEPLPTADTIACVYAVKAGWLTLMGKNGKKMNYWIPKK